MSPLEIISKRKLAIPSGAKALGENERYRVKPLRHPKTGAELSFSASREAVPYPKLVYFSPQKEKVRGEPQTPVCNR